MLEISKDQEAFYSSARDRCRQEVDQMNNTILDEWTTLNDEIARVQNLIQDLEGRKQIVGQMYGASSDMLGLENDLDISSPIKDEE